MPTFKELGLSDNVVKVLAELEFETPTEIQEQAIPHLLQEDTDFIGLAQTGTGKTAAFGLPLLERVDPSGKHTQALVLAPTRELGQQIAEQLNKYSKYLDKVNVLAVYGGAPIVKQIKDLKRPQHVIIATPGRLIDLIKRKAVHLDKLGLLVLDEADEMLNMGFKDELDEILSYTPKEKMTWLFSATMPNEIKRIVKKFMDEPFEVRIDPKNEVNTNIEHQFTVVKTADKTAALERFMDTDPDIRAIVFCRTRRDTQGLAENLMKNGYRADALHGELSQSQRDRVMKRFKSYSIQVLIATDVAARGIDVNDLTHVFHYALPDDDSYYTHRSGRTARAGKKGISLSFVGVNEDYKIRRLSKQLGISFEKVLIPDTADIKDKVIDDWALKLLEQQTSGKVDQELVDKVNTLFGNLSKEELVVKLLVQKLENMNLGTPKDLNATSSGRGDRSDGGRRGRDDRGGRGRSEGRGGRGGRSDGRRPAGRGSRYEGRSGKSESRGRTESRGRSTGRGGKFEGRSFESRPSEGRSRSFEGRSSEGKGRSFEGRSSESKGRSFENRSEGKGRGSFDKKTDRFSGGDKGRDRTSSKKGSGGKSDDLDFTQFFNSPASKKKKTAGGESFSGKGEKTKGKDKVKDSKKAKKVKAKTKAKSKSTIGKRKPSK